MTPLASGASRTEVRRLGRPLVSARVTRPVTALALVLAGCQHSTATGPTPGNGSGPPPHGLTVDTFAYAVSSSSGWTLANGVIAAYLLQSAERVRSRGAFVPSSVPSRVTTRLIGDTIQVGDTLGGPPPGTDLQVPSYITFDQAGNIWMSVAGTHGDGSVIEYSRAQLSQNGSLDPTVTLTGSHLPLGLAFDTAGNLWVVDSATTQLHKYTALEQRTGGPPDTSVSLAGITAAGATWAPLALKIDAHGNFWISAKPRTLPAGPAADSVPAYIVARITDSAIQAGGTPAPTVVLAQHGVHPGGYGPALTFDPTGNLWTGNANLASITEFTTGTLVPGASPMPAITITGPQLQGVGDVAIDRAGVVYVGGGAYGTPGAGIFAYSPLNVTTSGSPTPKLSFRPSSGVTHFAIR
jgi:hypothetical protein